MPTITITMKLIFSLPLLTRVAFARKESANGVQTEHKHNTNRTQTNHDHQHKFVAATSHRGCCGGPERMSRLMEKSVVSAISCAQNVCCEIAISVSSRVRI
jgi:AMMECR1 domain-containing protein